MSIIDSNATLGASIQFAAKNLRVGDVINIRIAKCSWGIYADIEGEVYDPQADNLIDDIMICTIKSNPNAQ